MKVVGMTGPTGAGKTTALAVCAAMGGLVIDCDAVYHRLLETDEALRGALKARFGTAERKGLAAIVFADPEALAYLNEITHRFVCAEVEVILRRGEAEGYPLAAIDAIALIESGLAARCDVTIAITAPREARIARIMAREGIDAAYAARRADAQKGEEFFRASCTHTIENSGSKEMLEYEVRRILTNILYNREETKMEEKTLAEQKREALLCKRKNGYDRIGHAEEEAIRVYCDGYKKYLDRGKTERGCVDYTVELAQAAGFRPFVRGDALKAGDKIYRVNRGRGMMLAVIGSEGLDKGANLCAAHIDSPRLDLKQIPLYEDGELAYLKTHYYGGVRKYQWVATPLELQGVVALKNGNLVQVSVGGNPGDPVFVINDLLPHLAADQSKKTLGEAIPAESLNIMIGSRPFRDDTGAERVKLAIMDLLHQRYGIVEEDLASAELMAVPAFRASDVGFDRSLLGAYGHDDRVCAYAALLPLLEMQGTPKRTAVCILADKEEVGSSGVSGMKSAAFDTFMSDLCDTQRVMLKVCYENSYCLSADVTAAYDPNFGEVYDPKNSARINYGVGVCKYTGARGKAGASDASAEVMAELRRLLDDAGVVWQTAELGKADQGGGGTVAAYIADRDIDVIDAGVPVLSMHAPFEVVGKLDCYMAYQASRAVYHR